MLKNILNLNDYLNQLLIIKDKYIIFIACQGKWETSLSTDIASKLLQLGLTSNLFRHLNASYIALLDEGKLLYEKNGKKHEALCYKNNYKNLELDIVSVGHNTKFKKYIPSNIGISLNNNLKTFNKRGISIVVFDNNTDIIIDAVSFDTFLPTCPTFRADEYCKLLIEKINELHAGFGYTIAQWLYDHEFLNISIIIDPQFSGLIKYITLPIKMNDAIFVNQYYTISDNQYILKYTDNAYFIKETYYPLELNTIKPNDTIIYLSPNNNNFIKHSIESTGAMFLTLKELIDNAYIYIKNDEAILNVLSQFSGVHAAFFSLPNIKQDKSENAKHILSNNINRLTVNEALLGGNRDSHKISQYILENTNLTDDDWLELICYPNPIAYNDEQGNRKFKDKVGKYVNIINGHRVTSFNPITYDNTIYIVGGCNSFGIYNADHQTFASVLQKLLNEHITNDRTYKVENYSHFLSTHFIDKNRVIKSLKPIPGDIILCQGKTNSNIFDNIPLDNIELPNNIGHLFYDHGHFTENLHKYIAEYLFSFLVSKQFYRNNIINYRYRTMHIPISGLQRNINLVKCLPNEYVIKLNKYKLSLQKIRSNIFGRIGSIVMNCNPFTLGHRYLVEYAINKVNHLFVFVVEEDKSIFSFSDRFDLIIKGTADFCNITVIPSGEFIISSLTFSEYFQKSTIQDRTIDPSWDIELFAKEIAPSLGINIRFAGDEPLDKITMQYNEAMRRILPQYDIDFEIIPRKESDGKVISASRVRELLEHNDFIAIAKLVPDTTLSYLKNRYLKI